MTGVEAQQATVIVLHPARACARAPSGATRTSALMGTSAPSVTVVRNRSSTPISINPQCATTSSAPVIVPEDPSVPSPTQKKRCPRPEMRTPNFYLLSLIAQTRSQQLSQKAVTSFLKVRTSAQPCSRSFLTRPLGPVVDPRKTSPCHIWKRRPSQPIPRWFPTPPPSTTTSVSWIW